MREIELYLVNGSPEQWAALEYATTHPDEVTCGYLDENQTYVTAYNRPPDAALPDLPGGTTIVAYDRSAGLHLGYLTAPTPQRIKDLLLRILCSPGTDTSGGGLLDLGQGDGNGFLGLGLFNLPDFLGPLTKWLWLAGAVYTGDRALRGNRAGQYVYGGMAAVCLLNFLNSNRKT